MSVPGLTLALSILQHVAPQTLAIGYVADLISGVLLFESFAPKTNDMCLHLSLGGRFSSSGPCATTC